MKFAATAKLMRMLNRSAILDLIREEGPITRAQISRHLGISQSTVMRIISELIEENLVKWSGDAESTGGRPSPLLEFNPNAYVVIGIDLGGSKIFGTVANLGGHIQKEIYASWEGQLADEKESVEQVCKQIEQLINSPRPASQKVRGIGIGAPGVTLSDKGIVQWAPSLKWRNLPLRDILQERFGLPVIVENDVNLAALGEYGFGVARGSSKLICMAIGTGIGAGIIIDRKIYKGHTYSAGEIGYLLPEISCLGKSYPGFGALESIASGTGIARRAIQYLEKHNLPVPPDLNTEQVFAAARAGEKWADQIIQETVDYLAFSIAALSVILDPEVIVLGGGVARSADILIDPIIDRLQGAIPSVPSLVQSNLGYRAAAMGAILIVLDATTEHVTLTTPI